jgi:hypothetical protein
VVAIGIFLSYTTSISTQPKKQCDIEKTLPCVVFNNGQQISVQFLQQIEVEEEITLSIELPKNTKIEKMWVQGLNMYMGKSAVITDNIYVQDTRKVYNARLFLGSCSEPAMRWQMIVETSNDSGLQQSWFFNFSTDRNKKS